MKTFRFGNKLAVMIGLVLLVCFVGESYPVQAFPGNAPLNQNISTLPDLIFYAYAELIDLEPNVGFSMQVLVKNVGGVSVADSYYVDLYIDRAPAGVGDHWAAGPLLAPGEMQMVNIPVTEGLPEGIHELTIWVDFFDDVLEEEEITDNWYSFMVTVVPIIFQDDFESGTLSNWSSVNTGGGFLTACAQGAVSGAYGACVARGSNNNRKQLIDQTPANETVFTTRFYFDPNSLSMGLGEPVRIMQMKMGAERPAFLVLQRFSDGYYIQLNVKEDDLTKVKTAWIPIQDWAHLVEVDWAAASSPSANDGYAYLFVNSFLRASLIGLDNNSFSISSFRLGFTSRLAGKNVSGVFYIDNVYTGSSGRLTLP